MKDTNIYIKQICIGNKSAYDLNYELHKDFNFDYNKNEDLITLEEGLADVENAPIKIEVLENILLEYKKKEATHISLDYHEDHANYETSGFIIRKATQDEIDEFRGKNRKKQEESKQAKIDRLKKELRELES